MDHIEMTRQQFCQQFGWWPADTIDGYTFYDPATNQVTTEIVLISEAAKAEIDWLERLWAL